MSDQNSKVFGTVVSVTLSTQAKKRDGGTYEAWELIYRDGKGEIKTITKPVSGFKFEPALKAGLSNLKSGDKFTMHGSKNAAGFLDWKSVEIGGSSDTVSAGLSAPVSSNGVANRNNSSNTYPTSEERQQTQKQIVAQSSFGHAVTLAGPKAKLDDVKEVAEDIYNFIFDLAQGKTKSAAEKDAPDLESDDIPL